MSSRRSHRSEGELAARAELRRRTRRVGLFYLVLSPIAAVAFALMFRVWFGVLCGALSLAIGLYFAFAYLPFAGWLRRREQSRSR